MANEATRRLARIGEGIALVCAIVTGGLFVIGAIVQMHIGPLLAAILLVPWLVGPIAIAGLLVGTAARPAGAAAFLALQLLFLAGSVGLWVYSRIFDPWAGLFLMLLPIYQFVAIGLALAVAALFGWRFWPEPAPDEA